MKSLAKAAVCLIAIVIGVWCCTQIFVIEDPNSELTKGWEWVAEEPSSVLPEQASPLEDLLAIDSPFEISGQSHTQSQFDSQTAPAVAQQLQQASQLPPSDFSSEFQVNDLPALDAEMEVPPMQQQDSHQPLMTIAEENVVPSSPSITRLPDVEEFVPETQQAFNSQSDGYIANPYSPSLDQSPAVTPPQIPQLDFSETAPPATSTDDPMALQPSQDVSASQPFRPSQSMPPAEAVLQRNELPVEPAKEISQRLPSLPVSTVVENRAKEHITYGKSLARRGSVYSARQEFLQAIRLIADSNDATSQSRSYSTKLTNGLRALEESEDFVKAGGQSLGVDMQSIIETHATSLIPAERLSTISPIQAMQTYYAYATSELSQAIGNSTVASEAFHAMGKLTTSSTQLGASGKSTDRAMAIVMHAAALSADGDNYRSSNELGVLMANNGRWAQAKDFFIQSLQARQMSATWRNLARTHEKLGERELARLAWQEHQLVARREAGVNMNLPTQWTAQTEFDQRAAMPEVEGFPQVATVPPQAVPVAPKKETIMEKVKGWF